MENSLAAYFMSGHAIWREAILITLVAFIWRDVCSLLLTIIISLWGHLSLSSFNRRRKQSGARNHFVHWQLAVGIIEKHYLHYFMGSLILILWFEIMIKITFYEMALEGIESCDIISSQPCTHSSCEQDYKNHFIYPFYMYIYSWKV